MGVSYRLISMFHAVSGRRRAKEQRGIARRRGDRRDCDWRRARSDPGDGEREYRISASRWLAMMACYGRDIADSYRRRKRRALELPHGGVVVRQSRRGRTARRGSRGYGLVRATCWRVRFSDGFRIAVRPHPCKALQDRRVPDLA